jgi:Serine carboxypeptidase
LFVSIPTWFISFSILLKRTQSTTIGGKDTAINRFYNNPLVQDALNAPHKQWIQCSGHINGRDLLAQDRPISMLPYIATLLDEANIRVLVYNGDRDYIGNHPGSELSLNTMRWSGSTAWKDTRSFTRGLYINAPKSVGGFVKQYQNLNLLAVYNSGHMVPYNRPLLALDLVTRFLGNVSFIDVELPHYQARHFQRSKKDIDEYDEELYGYDDDEIDTTKSKINAFIHSYMGSIFFLLTGLCCGVMISCLRRGKYDGYEEINDS